jgi:O-antigen/teichoic acid export membrane protein
MLKPTDRTRSLLGNTAVLGFAQVSGMLVSLVLTPYIVATLGVERFGLWAFLGSVVAYAGLLQFGLGRGSVRFISLYSERGEIDVVRRIVSYSVLAHILAGVLLTPLAWLIARAVFPHVHLSHGLVSTAEILFPLVLAQFFFAGAVFPFAALLIGLERMWMTSAATLASQLIYATAVVTLLSQGKGLYGLLAATFLQTAFQGAVYYVIGRRLIGQVLGNPFRLNRSVVSEMLRFGGWLQVSRVANLVNSQTDSILIAGWVNVASVGLYDLGNRVARLVRTLPLTLLGPLLPAAAAIHAQGDAKRVARTVLQGSRLVGVLTLGMAGFVLATAPLIMRVWLGHDYPHVSAICILMVIAYGVNNLTGVGTTVVSAIGQPRYESEYAVLGMLLNVAATLILAPFFGLYGVVGGTVFGVVVCSLYFLWRFHRLMALSMRVYLLAWLWRLLAATTVSGAVVLGLRLALPESLQSGRARGAVVLMGLGLLYCCLMLVTLRTFRFLQGRDLAILKRILPGPLQPLTRLPAMEFFFDSRA